METRVEACVGILDRLISSQQTSLVSLALSKVKKVAVLKSLNSISKINSAAAEDNFSSNSRSNYESIRPIESGYSSIVIINNEGFDLEAENRIVSSKIQELKEQKFQKKDFLERYFNQTKKPVLRMDQFPESIYASKDIQTYNPVALQKIRSTSFQDFLDQVLAKKSSWGKPVDRMQYKKSTIKTPLTKVEENNQDKALDMFNTLLRFDTQVCGMPKCYYVAQIANEAISMCPQLVEELFVQVIKQMNGPRVGAYAKLMCVLCTVVKVPLRIYIPLLNYFVNNAHQEPKEFTYMFYALIKNFDKPRKVGVSVFQANMIMHLKKVPVTMNFPTEKTFFMESTDTVDDLMEQVVSYFELDRNVEYMFYCCQKYLDRGKLFDVLYSLDQVTDDDGLFDNYKSFTGFKMSIVHKNQLDLSKSHNNTYLLYAYQCEKFIQGLYSLRKDQVATLGALKYYAQNDGLDNCDISLYLPQVFLKGLSREEGRPSVIRLMVAKIKGITCTKEEARKKLIWMLMKKDAFKAHVFPAQLYFQDDDEQLLPAMLFVKSGCIHVVGSGDFSVHKRIRFQEIVEWGRTQSEICFRVQNSGTFHFQCQNQSLVNEIFQTYLSRLGELVEEDEKRKSVLNT